MRPGQRVELIPSSIYSFGIPRMPAASAAIIALTAWYAAGNGTWRESLPAFLVIPVNRRPFPETARPSAMDGSTGYARQCFSSAARTNTAEASASVLS